MEEVIKIEKDDKGNYWLNYPDSMTDYEAIGILHMMIKRIERVIITEEVNKVNKVNKVNEPLV